MKPKHTPGPWNIRLYKTDLGMNGIGVYEVNGPKGIVCNCEESCIEETEANARLISAAPELLEALELIYATEELSMESMCALIKALQTARGEK